MYRLVNFDPKTFIETYWQKKPAIFRQVFKHFNDPMDEHELAGLAQEEGIDSRIISQNNNQWHVNHGPFTAFDAFCKGKWSLLVQAVDTYIPDAQKLMQAFNFIPNWRRDDLMVSFSNEGAGVGPHLDQYDVFIIQGKGQRRWQIGVVGTYDECSPHEDLKQIKTFEPYLDEILQPGDMVYIPPGCPHHGVALENCLNYSIGFRAPNQQDLLSSLADFALDSNLFTQRYQDPDLEYRLNSAEITEGEIKKIRALLSDMITSEYFEAWLGEFASRTTESEASGFSCSLGSETENAENYSPEDIKNLLIEGTVFYPDSSANPVYMESKVDNVGYIENKQQPKKSFTFFLGGQAFNVLDADKKTVQSFLGSPYWPTGEHRFDDLSMLTLLAQLVNLGFWYHE